jgi:CBS domain-containing protein
MKVLDVMTHDVTSCELDTNLAAVTQLLWQADCGALPVMDNGRIHGMITDRDICIALGTRNLPASELKAADVVGHDVFTCAPEDEIHRALKTMRTHKIRRLPVIDHEGQLAGILSLNEIVLRSHRVARKSGDLTYEDVATTLKAVCEHRQAEHRLAEQTEEAPDALLAAAASTV